MKRANNSDLEPSLRRDAAFELAVCHWLGFGTPRNIDAALKYLNSSARTAQELESIIEQAGKIKGLTYRNEDFAELWKQGIVLNPDLAQIQRETRSKINIQVEFEREISDLEIALTSKHPLLLEHKQSLARYLIGQGFWVKGHQMFLEVLEALKACHEGTENAILPVLSWLSITLEELGEYTEAESLGRQALLLSEKLNGPVHALTASTILNLANILIQKGEYEEGKEMIQRSIEAQTAIFGVSHPITCDSLLALSAVLSSQGEWDEAYHVAKKALGSQVRILGASHPDVLSSRLEIAEILFEMGKYKEAEEQEENAVTAMNDILGELHPETLAGTRRLAMSLAYRNQWETAEKMLDRIVDLTCKEFGKQNIKTFLAMSNLSFVYREQGRMDKARVLDEQVLSLSEAAFGRENIHTVAAIAELGFTLSKISSTYDEASKLLREALAMREKFFGPHHPETLMSGSILADVYAEQGKYEDSVQLAMDVLEKRKSVLGPDHSDTLITRGNLANTYYQMGKHQLAKQMETEVLEAYQRTLGLKDSLTIQTMSNLAMTYAKLEEYDRAETFAREALHLSIQCRGKHDKTAYAMKNLGEVLEACGKTGEALTQFREAYEMAQEVLSYDPESVESFEKLVTALESGQSL